MMRFRILGPVEVRTPQGWRSVGAAKWRDLLGVLLVRPGRVVAMEQLIAEVWPEEAPSGARKLINLYALRLRRLIGDPGGEVLVTRPPGYLLRLGSGDVDAQCFEDQLALARRAWEGSQAERAMRALTAALQLWNGAALADVSAPSALLEATRLEEVRISALVMRAEAGLACGRHADLVAELRQLVAAHPIREQFWRQLICALQGAGREAEALQAYEDARKTIADELGTTPGPELQAIYQAMLARNDVIPGSVVSRGDVGAVTTPPIHQLPSDVLDFTGRESQTAQLVALLGSASSQLGVPVAVICGPPGVGKTSLALHVAHRLRGEYPDGQFYIQLEGTSASPRDSHEVLGEMLRAVGVSPWAIPESKRERTAMLRSALSGRRILLVADDAAAADQVEPLIPGAVGAAVIVTSSSLLAVPPGGCLLHLDPLSPDEAVEMLSQVVGRDRVSKEPDAAGRLVAACGFLPLAIRIASARLAARASWPLGQFAGMISTRRGRLAELHSGTASIRASFGLSYGTLPAPAQQAFRLLGLLGPADFAAWTITALVGGGLKANAADVLADRCILTSLGIDQMGQPRYRLHGLLRDYALERLADDLPEDRQAALQRVAAAWAEIASLASRTLPSDPYYPLPERPAATAFIPEDLSERVPSRPLAWFNTERANLIHVTEQACSAGMIRLAHRLISAQCGFHFFQGRFDDHERLLDKLAEAAIRVGDQKTLVDTQLRLAGITAHRGLASEAMTMFDRCFSSLQASGDLVTLAAALYWQAYCAQKQGLVEIARVAAERSLGLAREIGDRRTELMALRILGEALAHTGDHGSGLPLCEQALALAQTIADPYYEQLSLRTFAHVASLAGNWDLAINLCRKGLDLTATSEPTADHAYFLSLLGGAQNGIQRYNHAIKTLSHAAEIFDHCGDRRAHARCLLSLAQAYRLSGDHRIAVVILNKCLPVFQELLLTRYERQALLEFAACEPLANNTSIAASVTSVQQA